MATLKKNSEAWRLAKKFHRRKHCMSRPIALSEDGITVTLQSMLRGNTYTRTLRELQLRD